MELFTSAVELLTYPYLKIVPGSLALSLPGLVGAGLVILGGKWFSSRTVAKSAAGATGE